MTGFGSRARRRRLFGALLPGLTATVAGAGLLGACRQGTDGGETVQARPSGKDVTITHLFNWAPAQFVPMDKNTNAFMAANPKIKVVSTPAAGAVWPDKPLSLFAAGTPPDVMSGDVSLFRWKLAEQGLLTVLDPYIKVEKLDLSDFDADMLKGGNYNGKQYGLTFFGSVGVFGYNKVLFERRGVKPPAPTWTMQDFLSTAQTLTRRAGDKATDTYGLAALPPAYYMESFLYANGARVLDEGRTKCTLEAPEAVATLQWWQDALWKQRVAPVAADGETAGIPSGQVGMWLMTPHSTPGHRQNNPFDWDIAPLPVGTKGKGSANSDFTYIVAKDAPAQAETWAFMVHMTSKASQEVNAQEALLLPARKSALPAFGSPNQPPATPRIFAESFRGSQAPSIYRTPLVIDLNTPYNALYNDSVIAQKVPLQDGITNTARAVNALLQTYRQQPVRK